MKKILFILIAFLIPVFFTQAVSPVSKSTSKPVEPIRILLVPGHDNEVWGAQYGNIKEANMTLVLATQVYNLLKKDKRFEVYITRDSSGYTKEFADYFSQHKEDIISFRQNAKQEMQAKVATGSFVQKETVIHNSVTKDTSIVLYGINKWVDENKMDAVIHFHFNDYPRPTKWKIGEYKGFTIYMPDGQLANSKESSKLAGSIFSQLHKKYQSSTLPEEIGGMVPDQKLIALGANDTLNPDTSSVLVEYGYIYEKMFRKSSTRHQAYKTMAGLTTKGITNYFFGK